MDKKFQVIIAHPIPEERQRMAALFESSGLFSLGHMTHDGLDCLRAVVAAQPDLVLVHGVLDKIDGLEVLRRLEEFPLSKTRRIYITNYNNFLAEHAVLSGADHCIMMPCPDEVLFQRSCELILPPQESASDEEINTHTAHILHAISAPTNKKGYFYAIDAVRILVRDPKLVMRRKVITELYGGIAQLHSLEKPEQVERCLRTLTGRVFAKNSIQTLREYFNLADVQRGHITNTAFLTAVAKHVTTALRAEREAVRAGAPI